MRSAITRAVEEIKRQYNLAEGLLSADERERVIRINFPATKKFISIPPYTEKSKIKASIRKFLKDEEGFQDMMRQARQTPLL